MSRPTYTATLIANNVALQEMNKTLRQIARTQKQTTQVIKNANAATEETIEIAETRSQAADKLIKKLKQEGRAFNIVSTSASDFKNLRK